MMEYLITSERQTHPDDPVSVAYLDLDKFKLINDNHGHQAGDEVIQQVGEHLQRTLDEPHIACHRHGDEFSIVFPRTSGATAGEIANAVRESLTSIARSYASSLPNGRLTASIGVAEWQDATASVTEFIRAADLAQKQAKEAGGDQVRIADDTLT